MVNAAGLSSMASPSVFTLLRQRNARRHRQWLPSQPKTVSRTRQSAAQDRHATSTIATPAVIVSRPKR